MKNKPELLQEDVRTHQEKACAFWMLVDLFDYVRYHHRDLDPLRHAFLKFFAYQLEPNKLIQKLKFSIAYSTFYRWANNVRNMTSL